ncbi:hypothetical protein EMIT0111MI5_20237 [Burkholderia sp. IT-111MI5]
MHHQSRLKRTARITRRLGSNWRLCTMGRVGLASAMEQSGSGPVPANNGLANAPFRLQCKEGGAPFGHAKQATSDAAMRPERCVPQI